MKKQKILVSACLLGVNCRYDGLSKSDPKIINLLSRYNVVPVCPEQLGGLPTPRPAAEIFNGTGKEVLESKAFVENRDNIPVTDNFLKGADQALKIAKLLNIKKAVFKERSPSCGVHYIRSGDKIIKGCGVTTALFLKNSIEVISDEEIE